MKRRNRYRTPEGGWANVKAPAGHYYDDTGNLMPLYPVLSGLAKYRKAARKGLAAMTREERHAYGDAVSAAILELQHRELYRIHARGARLSDAAAHCASGTSHNDPEKIEAAIRSRHLAELHACPSRERRSRSAQRWKSMYAEAMAEHRAREGYDHLIKEAA